MQVVTTYTAESLEDIAAHFDQKSSDAASLARRERGVARKSLLGVESEIWREAAAMLRATRLLGSEVFKAEDKTP